MKVFNTTEIKRSVTKDKLAKDYHKKINKLVDSEKKKKKKKWRIEKKRNLKYTMRNTTQWEKRRWNS